MTTVGRWSPNKVRARVLDGTWVSAEELGGMVLLTPTSIAYTGTSASIGTNGSVEFSAISVLELRGVFSADYDNYLVVSNYVGASGDDDGEGFGKLMSGTTPTTGTDYTAQFLQANSTTVAAARSATSLPRLFSYSDSSPTGVQISLYGPFLAQPTAIRTVTNQPRSAGLRIIDYAFTHSLSTSYDGLYFAPVATAITGSMSVYGLVGA